MPRITTVTVDSLKQIGPLDRLGTLIITHLTPKRLDSLRSVLSTLLDAGAPVEVWLSNPAMQLLQATAGAPGCIGTSPSSPCPSCRHCA